VDSVTAPEPGVTADYGAYLAGPVAHCLECHTPMGPQGPMIDTDLGRGGFGEVYKGRRASDQKLVAIKHLFAGLIPPADADAYIAGLILLGAAPCTAMVFVWSQLTRGDPNYTLVQVSVNDVIMVFAYAPIVALLLGVTDIPVPWATLVLSVMLYIVVPLVAGFFTRRMIGDSNVPAFTARLKPWSITGLLATVILLFGFQGEQILNQPLVIVMLAIPIRLCQMVLL
jgi:ACR3 family arsenite efflux pump ArsB